MKQLTDFKRCFIQGSLTVNCISVYSFSLSFRVQELIREGGIILLNNNKIKLLVLNSNKISLFY